VLRGPQAAPLRNRGLRRKVRRHAFPQPRHDTQTRGNVPLEMRARASLAFARAGFDLDGDHRLIVERIYPCGVLGHRLEDLVHHAAR
jgi:hypothetical protein